MEKHYIEFDGREYEVHEPTIELWNQLNTLKDLGTEDDFILSLIALSTGLLPDKIREAEWESVNNTAEFLAHYFMSIGDKFHNEFDFKGQKYRFMDLNNMTFGEFIDIDSFLSQDESKKQSQMNHLMALLYREVDENGKTKPYNASEVPERAEKFRSLPVKYLRGSMSFFLRLENILLQSSRSSLTRRIYKLKWRLKRHLRVFGGGILRLYIYLMKTYSRCTSWLKNHLWKS